MRGDRRRRSRARGLLTIALVVVVTACSSSARTSTPSAPTPGTDRPAAPLPSAWPLPGQNYDNARAAVGSTITAANVDRLAVAFTATPAGLASLSTAPLVIDRTAFFEDGTGKVIALDARTSTLR